MGILPSMGLFSICLNWKQFFSKHNSQRISLARFIEKNEMGLQENQQLNYFPSKIQCIPKYIRTDASFFSS